MLDEKAVNTTAKAFLIPDKDLINEIGYGRKSIFPDFIHTSMEYGISLDTLVHRALECNLITESVCKDHFRHKGKVEQSMIESEVPTIDHDFSTIRHHGNAVHKLLRYVEL